MYTHNFEIKFNGVTLTGEINFDGDVEPKIHFTEPPEVTMHTMDHFMNLMKSLTETCKDCGPFEIEITKK